jgi:molybdopterin-synthase adenylyltransferase
MTFSAALTEDVHRQIGAHVLRADGQEDLCFALWHPSGGRTRTTALISEPLLPEPGDRNVHGNASFEASYFLRSITRAQEHGAGLALIHSHPLGAGWQGMSRDDIAAEAGHAAQARATTGQPLVGLTMGGDGSLSARRWTGTRRSPVREDADSVRVTGAALTVTWNDALRPPPEVTEQQLRTVSAWGESAQQQLSRLRVGIIGAGSVGSLIAEALARTGIAEILLIDFDSVKLHNLDRLLHASERDVRLVCSKVEVLARGLRRGATASEPKIQALEYSVVEEDGWRAALDCDVLFSCVDRPWPRSALNLAAYSHLIPVVDGGIAVDVSRGRLRGADWKAHIAAPSRRCLECTGQYDPALVQAEREGHFDDPTYIRGLPQDHALRRNENVFAFSAATASLEVLQFLSMALSPNRVADIGAQNHHFVTGQLDVDTRLCRAGCPYTEQLTALGDDCGVTTTARHHAAEHERAARQKQRTWRVRLRRRSLKRLDHETRPRRGRRWSFGPRALAVVKNSGESAGN